MVFIYKYRFIYLLFVFLSLKFEMIGFFLFPLCVEKVWLLKNIYKYMRFNNVNKLFLVSSNNSKTKNCLFKIHILNQKLFI